MEDTKKPTLYLVDGSNYLFQAFYAIRELSNSQGFPTNAIYGFTTMLLKLLRENNPEYIAVTFDLKGPTFRHEAYDKYKATRKAAPEAIIPQIPYVKEIVRAFGIPVLEQAGIEADDIIGTLVSTYTGQGMRVVMVSGDKDLMQLVSENAVLIDTMKDKCYDVAAVRERFGVEPAQVSDILALAGDTSDNIPGVPGIGLKGAERLIQEFGSVENLLNNIEKIKNGRAKAAIQAYADQARLSLELARIRLNAVIDFRLEDSLRSEPDMDALKRLFGKFEFSSLLQDLKIKDEAITGNYRIILDEELLHECLRKIVDSRSLAVELVLTMPEAMRAEVVGIALCPASGEAYYIPLSHLRETEPGALKAGDVWEKLKDALADEKISKYGHDLKTMKIVLGRKGIGYRGLACDTLLAAYLLNPSQRSFELADIMRDYAGRSITSLKDLTTAAAKSLPLEMLPADRIVDYACGRADAVFGLVS
ncbi:MAG: 5'-3' exonuclease H3TH domain-containing protein, partial [Syntrophales bacterium]|nr:5'-3' exonuclease H3TH domain-containing protein [Syntrophales bacterium]